MTFPLDANGWTIIPPSPDSNWSGLYPAAWADHYGSNYTAGYTAGGTRPAAAGDGTRMIFISSSLGAGGNPGTIASPVATIAQGLALLRTGNPDWHLLRCTDTFQDESYGDISTFAGRSGTELMIFSSYSDAVGVSNLPPIPNPGNSGATRPYVRTPPYQTGFTNAADKFGFLGIRLKAYYRDPAETVIRGLFSISASGGSGYVNGTTIKLLASDGTTLDAAFVIITGTSGGAVTSVQPCFAPAGPAYSTSGQFTVDPTAFTQTAGGTTVGTGATFSSPVFAVPAASGMVLGEFNNASHYIFEDNRVEFYDINFSLNGGPAGGNPTSVDMQARRNFALNAWDDVGNVSKGFGCNAWLNTCTWYQNFADLNGWNPTLAPSGNSLYHNYYFSGQNNGGFSSAPTDYWENISFTENVSTNELFDTQWRTGSYMANNLWVMGINGVSNAFNYIPRFSFLTNICENNIFFVVAGNGLIIGGAANSPDDSGGLFYAGDTGATGIVRLNIATGAEGTGATAGSFINPQLGATFGGIPAHGDGTYSIGPNIAYRCVSTTMIDATQTYTDLGGNVLEPNTVSNGTHGWPFPNRTIGTYMDMLLGGSGHTIQDYVDAYRQMSKSSWNHFLEAGSVNDYIRQGFGYPMLGSAYANTQGGATVTDSMRSMGNRYGVYKTRPTKIPHAA